MYDLFLGRLRWPRLLYDEDQINQRYSRKGIANDVPLLQLAVRRGLGNTFLTGTDLVQWDESLGRYGAVTGNPSAWRVLISREASNDLIGTINSYYSIYLLKIVFTVDACYLYTTFENTN